MKKHKIVSLGQKRLQEWLSTTKRSINAFVLDARINYKIGWKYVRGETRPGLEMSVRIETLTDGYVLPRHWLEPYSEPEVAHKKHKASKRANAKENHTNGT